MSTGVDYRYQLLSAEAFRPRQSAGLVGLPRGIVAV
jgi:hypothetical protein